MTRPISFSSGERVLLIASAGIGNILQFTPALRAMKLSDRDILIDCLCFTKSAATTMRNNPHIAEIWTHAGSSYFYSDRAARITGRGAEEHELQSSRRK